MGRCGGDPFTRNYSVLRARPAPVFLCSCWLFACICWDNIRALDENASVLRRHIGSWTGAAVVRQANAETMRWKAEEKQSGEWSEKVESGSYRHLQYRDERGEIGASLYGVLAGLVYWILRRPLSSLSILRDDALLQVFNWGQMRMDGDQEEKERQQGCTMGPTRQDTKTQCHDERDNLTTLDFLLPLCPLWDPLGTTSPGLPWLKTHQ